MNAAKLGQVEVGPQAGPCLSEKRQARCEMEKEFSGLPAPYPYPEAVWMRTRSTRMENQGVFSHFPNRIDPAK